VRPIALATVGWAMRWFAPKARGLRRLGFVATIASGLSLLAIGVTGVAAIDDRLEVVSSGPGYPEAEFIDYRPSRDGPLPHRDCPRDRESGES
jgi:hypothetical protein